MHVFNIPEDVINNVAAEIHSKTNKDYKIPVVGVPDVDDRAVLVHRVVRRETAGTVAERNQHNAAAGRERPPPVADFADLRRDVANRLPADEVHQSLRTVPFTAAEFKVADELDSGVVVPGTRQSRRAAR